MVALSGNHVLAGGDRFGRCQDVGLGGRWWEKRHKLDSNQVTIFLIALHGGSIVAVVTFEAPVRATDSLNACAIVDRGFYLLSGQERKLWIAWSACLSSRLMLLSSKIISGSTSTIILRKEWAAWYSVMSLEYKPHSWLLRAFWSRKMVHNYFNNSSLLSETFTSTWHFRLAREW